MPDEPPVFTWTGDLTDDCVCRSVPGYSCHAECMGGPSPDSPGEPEEWYCSVNRVDADGSLIRGADGRAADAVFHSSEADVLPLTGKAARMLCEMAILADLWRKRNGQLAAARATNTDLHRRVQAAEAAMADLLRCTETLASGDAWLNGSLGRKFLAYENHQLRERLKAAGLAWTTTRPTAVGWYWFREPSSPRVRMAYVGVDGAGEWVRWESGDERRATAIAAMPARTRWAGPIMPPGEGPYWPPIGRAAGT